MHGTSQNAQNLRVKQSIEVANRRPRRKSANGVRIVEQPRALLLQLLLLV